MGRLSSAVIRVWVDEWRGRGVGGCERERERARKRERESEHERTQRESQEAGDKPPSASSPLSTASILVFIV